MTRCGHGKGWRSQDHSCCSSIRVTLPKSGNFPLRRLSLWRWSRWCSPTCSAARFAPCVLRRRELPGCARLARRRQLGLVRDPLGSLQFGRLLLDQFDEMVDDVGILQAVVGQTADIDLVGAVAATGQADIGLARLARAVDDAADN